MSKNKKDVFKEGIDSYSVNLLWLNQKKDENLKYIHHAKNIEEITNNEQILIDELLSHSLRWAKENKKEDNAKIKIWYDSTLHTQEQIKNTQQVLLALTKQEDNNNITLNDINEIEFVKNNKILFAQNIPLYFRIDFLKLVIQAHELITEGNDGAIFSDLLICSERKNKIGNITGKCFNKKELFDEKYMNKLKESGIIFNSRYGGDDTEIPENQFLQIVNEDEAVNVLRHIINLTAERAVFVLNLHNKDLQKHIMSHMYNMPFKSTMYEFCMLYKGLKAGKLKCDKGFIEEGIPNNQWIEYKLEKHLYEPMGNAMDRTYNNFMYVDNTLEKIFAIREIMNFGYSRSQVVVNTRDCFIEVGSVHPECDTIIPEEGHESFEVHYWQNNHEVEAIGGFINYSQ